MNDYKIEKNIPIPAIAVPNKGGNHKYPFAKMKVGDSFFCLKKSVVQSASMYGKKHKMCFTTKAEGDGYRIWRIE